MSLFRTRGRFSDFGADHVFALQLKSEASAKTRAWRRRKLMANVLSTSLVIIRGLEDANVVQQAVFVHRLFEMFFKSEANK